MEFYAKGVASLIIAKHGANAYDTGYMNFALWRAQALLEQHIDLSHARLLVACSGGPDSVALLHMLYKKREETKTLQLYAAHFHHGIRGEDADADAAFVEALCEKWDIPCFVEYADVPKASREEGQSIEEAARILRYAFLRRAKGQAGADYILTAHHMQDQAETVLMHMLRGCGLSGLCGMHVQSNDVLRPFLTTHKDELEAYIAEWGLSYRIDTTNMDTDFLRNRIRHELLPLLQQRFNPSIVQGLTNMAALLNRDEEYLHALAQVALDDAASAKDKGVYERAVLAALPLPVKSRAVRIALQRASALADLHQAGIMRVCDLLQARTGTSVELPNEMHAWVNYSNLHIGKKEACKRVECCVPYQQGVVCLPEGRMASRYVKTMRKDEGPFVGYMDADKLPEGMVIRRRQPGDRFFPLGAKGARKLKEYLIDKKISRADREVPLLAKDQTVIFFPGGTIAEQVKVTQNTTRMMRVEYFPAEETQ